GRQCINMASGLAFAIKRSSTRYGASRLCRLILASTPIETQVSVTTQSAPATASSGSCVRWTRPPSRCAQSSTADGGGKASGQAVLIGDTKVDDAAQIAGFVLVDVEEMARRAGLRPAPEQGGAPNCYAGRHRPYDSGHSLATLFMMPSPSSISRSPATSRGRMGSQL